MSAENFIDLSVVELKDGRKGTVVLIYKDEKAACIELSGEEQGELVDITVDDVKRIVWTP